MKRWLLVGALMLTACAHKAEPARVQCGDAQGVYFDQVFERAEFEPDGRVRVWMNGESVVIDGVCAIAPAAQ